MGDNNRALFRRGLSGHLYPLKWGTGGLLCGDFRIPFSVSTIDGSFPVLSIMRRVILVTYSERKTMSLISDNVEFGEAKHSVNSRLIWNRRDTPGAFSFRAISYSDGTYAAHIFNTTHGAHCTGNSLREAFESAMNMVVDSLNR